MNSRKLGSLGLLGGLVLGGCSDPKIKLITPPGVEERRVAPPTSGSGAEAIGESPGGAASAAVTVSTTISEPTPIGQTKKSPTGLVYETLVEGTGPSSKPGQTVVANYVGKLSDGAKFDSSYDRGSPITFVVGTGKVIKGWDEGIPGMKVGEKRRLIIPSEMGYGARGQPPTIPPNSTLVFEVELVDAK